MTVALSDDARRLWDAATALNRAAGAVSLPPLLFLTDGARTPRPWETAARLPAGAGVIHRTFGAPDARETAERLREATHRAGVRLLIALDLDLAEAVGADGVHLPERALDQAQAVRARFPGGLITGAVHSAEAAKLARGLDAVILSPVFAPGGASAIRPALGLEGFRATAAGSALPVYALGGIDAEKAPGLIGAGACGIAGVDAIQAAFGAAVRI